MGLRGYKPQGNYPYPKRLMTKAIQITFEDKELGIKLFYWNDRHYVDTHTVATLLGVTPEYISRRLNKVWTEDTFKVGVNSASRWYLGNDAVINLLIYLSTIEGNIKARELCNFFREEYAFGSNSLFDYLQHIVTKEQQTA